MAADFVAERCQIVFDRSEFADDSAGSIGNDLTLGGEFASGPVDQGGAEFGFESGDMGRDVGLHGVQGPGGRRERTVFGDGEQSVGTIDRESGDAQTLTLLLRQLFPQETLLLLEHHGFEVVERTEELGDSLGYVCRRRD